jgi:hypothetical protein
MNGFSRVLAIDFGSTSTRAFLYSTARGEGFYVVNRDKRISTCRFDKGDFSSAGYVFDVDGPIYMGEAVDLTRESISLKYGFYPLTGCSDELLQEYRLLDEISKHSLDSAFQERLRQGLRDLFARLSRRVREVCSAHHLKVTNIGLSTPSQWTLDFEDLYREIVAEAFRHPAPDIIFVTETEALAHLVFTDHLDQLHDVHAPETQDPDDQSLADEDAEEENSADGGWEDGDLEGQEADDVVLVLDFGGHNMVCCYRVP